MVILWHLLQQFKIERMRKPAYLYNEAISNYHFSKQHPMKTKRLRMTHSLIQSYGLNKYLNMFQSRQATAQQMSMFHEPKYVQYLQNWVICKKDQTSTYKDQERKKNRQNEKFKALYKINQSFDCPGFEGLYNFCQLAVGSSLDAADLIVTGYSDIVVNWQGGYHHAKRNQASGFCYINDIVICILELLKRYPRVLYLDIDVHHGDGVQQAFFHTNRVMTVSFHQYEQDFFPGTGSLNSVGQGVGKYFAVNIPLKRGITDDIYRQLFNTIMDMVMSSFRPDAVVMQCGADSLSKDKLGHLNLSIKGHSECVKRMLGYGVPIILLGGGGYTIQNVSRCWVNQTAVAIGTQINDTIPEKDQFYQSYEQDGYKINFGIEPRPNQNTPEYLNSIIETVRENLRESQIRPCVAFHNAPKGFLPEQQLDWQVIKEDEDSLTDEILDKIWKIK